MVQGKPGGTVHISNGMPDVEALMQQWPLEVEQKLHTMKLPDSTLVTPFALLHIVCVCVRRCVCFSNIFPGTQLMGSNPDRFGAARFSTLVTPFALLHIVCVCVCACSFHPYASIHPFIYSCINSCIHMGPTPVTHKMLLQLVAAMQTSHSSNHGCVFDSSMHCQCQYSSVMQMQG